MSEPIAMESWQNMQVNMEDFLPGCLSIGQQQVDTLRLSDPIGE